MIMTRITNETHSDHQTEKSRKTIKRHSVDLENPVSADTRRKPSRKLLINFKKLAVGATAAILLLAALFLLGRGVQHPDRRRMPTGRTGTGYKQFSSDDSLEPSGIPKGFKKGQTVYCTAEAGQLKGSDLFRIAGKIMGPSDKSQFDVMVDFGVSRWDLKVKYLSHTKPIELVIKELTGNRTGTHESLRVTMSDTIKEVRLKYEAITEITVQQLMLSGKILEDDKTLSDYDISDKSTLHYLMTNSPVGYSMGWGTHVRGRTKGRQRGREVGRKVVENEHGDEMQEIEFRFSNRS